MKKTLVALAALLTFFAGNAFAVTYTFQDDWRNWAGDNYSGYWYDQSGTSADVIGSPDVRYMEATVTDNILTNVSIYFGQDNRELHDALFINTYNITTTQGAGWADWDFLILDGLASTSPDDVNGLLPTDGDGFYTVNSDYEYTTAARGRLGNPNGLTDDSVELSQNQGFSVTGLTDTGIAIPQGQYLAGNNYFLLEYDLVNLNIDVSSGFFLAYSPWCANDVIGGGTPVPEPNSMLLLGAGIFGLGLYRRMRK